MAWATVGALGACGLVYRRRWRPVAAGGGLAVLVTAGGLGLAAATWNPRSVSEPRYTGVLASAPAVVGDARMIVSGFTSYSHELAALATNVSNLYALTPPAPGYRPEPGTIRVLHVADLHLNPAGWDVIASIARALPGTCDR